MSDAPSSYESQLASVLDSVTPVRSQDAAAAWVRLDRLTKPPRSLGRLEHIAAHVAAVQRTDHPSVQRKVVLLMAGDHGVAAEGVSPYPQAVTAQMVANFSAGGAAINQISSAVGAEVRIYDVGVAEDVSGLPGVRVHKVAPGTENMALGPAMSREQCAQAVLVGVRAAREVAAEGYLLIGTGEMGIANTTAAAALAVAFTGAAPETVVGRGTGLDDEGLRRKREVVANALRINRIGELDAFGVLSAVGGFEIAAMSGVMIGAAQDGVCVLSDGYISATAALAAVSLCPAVRDYLMPSHLSAEPGHRVVLDALDLEPVFDLDMRLGEGTGAALAMGIVDAACRVLSGMATFDEAGVSEAAT